MPETGDRRSENARAIRFRFVNSDQGFLPGLHDHHFYRPHVHLRFPSRPTRTFTSRRTRTRVRILSPVQTGDTYRATSRGEEDFGVNVDTRASSMYLNLIPES